MIFWGQGVPKNLDYVEVVQQPKKVDTILYPELKNRANFGQNKLSKM